MAREGENPLMRKVITYGTYDLLHRGHVRLLERAKGLGDYLVVGVTADGFDKVRGKINVSQTLNERMRAVQELGIADEVIVEEYEGQKIDDVKRMGIDVFTVGSDWAGKFDYLGEYCEVVYLDRTQGVSSSELRAESGHLRLGYVGKRVLVGKYLRESAFVNGVVPTCVMLDPGEQLGGGAAAEVEQVDGFSQLLNRCDAVYLASHPDLHCMHIKQALEAGRHVLCESPVAPTRRECEELQELARGKGLVLADAIKTAYATAYHRLSLLAKSGHIGRVISVRAVCTSLSDLGADDAWRVPGKWSSSKAWGPAALLPLLQLLGCDYRSADFVRADLHGHDGFDAFGEVRLAYEGGYGEAVFGKAAKSEGSLVISGTDGYIYVPAPWWKTDYFEVRKEDPSQNRRYFFQLDGEGIRNELVEFARAVERGGDCGFYISGEVSAAISGLLGEFASGEGCLRLAPIEVGGMSCGEGVER